MKKQLALLLTLTMSLGLTACAAPESEPPAEEQTDLTEEKTEPDSAELIENIAGTEFGTAGASLKLAISAVDLALLSEQEDALEKLEAYTSQLTEEEKASFAETWQAVYDQAILIIDDFEDQDELLNTAGIEDFDPAEHSLEDFKAFNEAAQEFLK